MKSKKPANAERLLPPHAPGMRIGLFGGTFDPPHQAHLAAALLALKRLKLDRVWWLVTPGNPLKNTRGLAPLANRIAAARALTSHPRIDITGLEAVIKTRYTYDTISWLLARCPGVQFVWIMGADNLRSFHRWQKWRQNSEAGAYRRDRPPGPKPLRNCQPGGQRPCPRANSGTRRRCTARPQAARMGLPARPQITPVLNSITCPAHARWHARPNAPQKLQELQKLEEFKERKEAQTRENRG